MSLERREKDSRRTARASNEEYFRRLMEEAPGGKITPSDVSHVTRMHRTRVNERRPAEAMGGTRGGPQISFGSRTVATPRKDRKE
jgi:hypothetical protein